jgi:hypothetical protein
MFTDISKVSNVKDYLPLLNGVLITDLFVILLLNTAILRSTVLRKWYNQYTLSAVIADVLIILIGLIITRALYPFFFDTFSIWKFILLAVAVQVVHDLLFAALFTSVPKGVNRMLDTFKEYGAEKSYRAILADSGMMVMASLIGSYLAGASVNTNLIVLIVSVYLVPYFIYA